MSPPSYRPGLAPLTRVSASRLPVRAMASSSSRIEVGGVDVEHGVPAQGTGGGDVGLDVVEEQDLVRLHAEAPGHELVRRRVGLGQPDLVAVDDVVGDVLEAVGRSRSRAPGPELDRMPVSRAGRWAANQPNSWRSSVPKYHRQKSAPSSSSACASSRPRLACHSARTCGPRSPRRGRRPPAARRARRDGARREAEAALGGSREDRVVDDLEHSPDVEDHRLDRHAPTLPRLRGPRRVRGAWRPGAGRPTAPRACSARPQAAARPAPDTTSTPPGCRRARWRGRPARASSGPPPPPRVRRHGVAAVPTKTGTSRSRPPRPARRGNGSAAAPGAGRRPHAELLPDASTYGVVERLARRGVTAAAVGPHTGEGALVQGALCHQHGTVGVER